MFLQHIGKIDWPPEVVIFLHICKIGETLTSQCIGSFINFEQQQKTTKT